MDEQLNAVIALAAWYSEHKRPMPWRDNPTPYHVLISEFMLQQTQAATVVEYFNRFIKRFPDIRKLARASYEDVLNHWAGLGYYSRALNLHETAKLIAAMDEFPREKEELLALPGIGRYTAGAILSIAFDIPEPLLDANVERVLSRAERVPGSKDFKKQLWLHASVWVNTAYSHNIPPSVINQALMELGATVCKPKTPACPECPLYQTCGARIAGETDKFPPEKPKKEWVTVDEEVYCVFNSESKFLLRKRGGREWRAGLWDLPDTLPAPESKLVFKGAADIRLTVTRHKIFRTSVIYRYKGKMNRLDPEKFYWMSPAELGSPSIPCGPSLLRTMKKVMEILGSGVTGDQQVDEEGRAD
jgi:A/G-specific adenine glycosylase